MVIVYFLADVPLWIFILIVSFYRDTLVMLLRVRFPVWLKHTVCLKIQFKENFGLFMAESMKYNKNSKNGAYIF